MKKTLSLLLVLAMTFSLLASCSNEASTDTAEPTETSDSTSTTATATTTDTEPVGIVEGSSANMYIGVDAATQQRPGQAADTYTMCRMVYDTLFHSPSGNYDDLTGLLVDTWSLSDDSRVWVLNLHEDVDFANGEHMMAQDVYDCIEYLRICGQQSIFDPMESYGVTGDYQLTFTYYEPNPEFMYQFSVWQMGIFDSTEAWVTGDLVEGFYMVGTGPYYISDYSSGDYITFTANPNYWNEDRMAHIETINCKIILDTNTQITALQSGEIDLGEVTDYISYETLLAATDLSLIDGESKNRAIYFNVDGYCEALSNIRVREALSMMIDMEQVSLATSGGYGGVYDNAINDGLSYVHSRTYDPEGALAILEEEGVNPEDIVLTGLVNAAVNSMYTNLQAQFAACGVTLNFSVQDAPAVMSAGWNGEWDLWSEYGGANRFSFLSPLTMMFGETGLHDMCHDPDIDPILWNLVEEAGTAENRELALEKYNEMMQVLDENYAYIGNIRVPSWVAYSEKLCNVSINQYDGSWEVWKSWTV